MIFGPVRPEAAEGAILAHSLVAGGTKYRKGRVLSAADTAALAEAGIEEVTVARLEPGDLGEDAAAARIAAALRPGPGLSITASARAAVSAALSTRPFRYFVPPATREWARIAPSAASG
ncbi:MAG: hypothetical protein AAFW69_06810, partial [Pseudomonadota bacterium]